jgi:hypothetical protein
MALIFNARREPPIGAEWSEGDYDVLADGAAVAVKVNGGTAVPLASEDSHPDPADATSEVSMPER